MHSLQCLQCSFMKIWPILMIQVPNGSQQAGLSNTLTITIFGNSVLELHVDLCNVSKHLKHFQSHYIWDDHRSARLVVEFDVELCEVQRPSGLSVVEFVCFSEVFEVLVIGPNLNVMW